MLNSFFRCATTLQWIVRCASQLLCNIACNIVFLNMFQLNCSVFQRCSGLIMPKSASTLSVSMIRIITGYFLLILIIGEKSRSISSMLMPNAPVVPKIIYNDNLTYYPRIVPVLLYWPCNISVNTVKTEHSRLISSLLHGDCLAKGDSCGNGWYPGPIKNALLKFLFPLRCISVPSFVS